MSYPTGKFESLGELDWLRAVQGHFESHAPSGSGVVQIQHGAEQAVLKYGHLTGKHRLRHGLRDLFPNLRIPRLQEYRNLEWLRERGFGAPKPLAAGVVRRAGSPVFQFLATERVAGAMDLRELNPLVNLPGNDRELFFTLGTDVARLHAQGFVHRDLYPRNILARPQDGGWQVFYLDAWRGGPGMGLRGPAYDLACLTLFAPQLFDDRQTSGFLRAYFESSAQPPRRGFLRSIERQRRVLLNQLATRGRTRHGLPPLDWNLPEFGD